ncbi:MAG TPA: acetamidase/formamidase family protein, partial [Chloroflexota bacterium]
MTEHTLTAERLHFAWDNSLPAALEIEPGDSVVFETWDASGHFYTPASTGADVDRRALEPRGGHALTGPVAIHGASAGRTLVVDVLEMTPARWGFTAFGPGRGLLPDDFLRGYLRIWD